MENSIIVCIYCFLFDYVKMAAMSVDKIQFTDRTKRYVNEVDLQLSQVLEAYRA